jgi:hypothetical protein
MVTQFMFKIEPKLKKAAMKKAKEQGTTFSSVLNFATNAFVDGQLNVGLIVNEELNPRTKKMLARELKDIKEGKNMSPEFTHAKDAIAYLKNR